MVILNICILNKRLLNSRDLPLPIAAPGGLLLFFCFMGLISLKKQSAAASWLFDKHPHLNQFHSNARLFLLIIQSKTYLFTCQFL